MHSSACSEKVNLRVYLKSVDAKCDVANYGFKLSCPFKLFWNNQWGCVWYQDIVQVLVFKHVFDFTIGSLIFQLF